MLQLLNQRTQLSEQVGRVKRAEGQPVFDPAREEALLSELEKAQRGPLTAAALRAIYYEIFSASRAKQKRLRIAYVEASEREGYIAARDRFGAHEEFLSMPSVPKALEAVSKKKVDVAVIPAANITVSQSTAWSTHGVGICGEILSHRTKKASRQGGFVFYLVTRIKARS
jgi:chorismate mutase/prephenate dehydratase